MFWKKNVNNQVEDKEEATETLIKNELPDNTVIEEVLSQLQLPDTHDLDSFISALHASSHLEYIDEILEKYPSSLLEKRSRTILYLLIRYLQPKTVLEIGTYMAGTSEVIARTLRQNGVGTLITADPFGKERIPPILETWPESLRKHIVFLPIASMDCFMQFSHQQTYFDFLFIDGDHSYEYALFDLQMAARHAYPGAIVVMDNAEQTGVFWAVKTFLSMYPDWQELGSAIKEHEIANPYGSMKPSFVKSSFLVLQAPKKIIVTSHPRSFTTGHLEEKGLSGYELHFTGDQEEGILHALIFFRSFWHGGFEGQPEQIERTVALPIKAGEKFSSLKISPVTTKHQPENSYRTFEIVLSWVPNKPGTVLELTQAPLPI